MSPLEAYTSPKALKGRGLCVSRDTYPKNCKYGTVDPNMQCDKSIFDPSQTQACNDIEDRCMQCVECNALSVVNGDDSDCAKEPSCEVKDGQCANKQYTTTDGVLSCNTREKRLECLVDNDCKHNNVGDDKFVCDESTKQCVQVNNSGDPVRCEHDMTCGINARCSVKDIRMEGRCSESGNVCFSNADCGYTFDREHINSLGKCMDFASQSSVKHQDADRAICQGLTDQGSCNQKRGCSWDGNECITFDEVKIAESETCEGITDKSSCLKAGCRFDTDYECGDYVMKNVNGEVVTDTNGNDTYTRGCKTKTITKTIRPKDEYCRNKSIIVPGSRCSRHHNNGKGSVQNERSCRSEPGCKWEYKQKKCKPTSTSPQKSPCEASKDLEGKRVCKRSGSQCVGIEEKEETEYKTEKEAICYSYDSCTSFTNENDCFNHTKTIHGREIAGVCLWEHPQNSSNTGQCHPKHITCKARKTKEACYEYTEPGHGMGQCDWDEENTLCKPATVYCREDLDCKKHATRSSDIVYCQRQYCKPIGLRDCELAAREHRAKQARAVTHKPVMCTHTIPKKCEVDYFDCLKNKSDNVRKKVFPCSTMSKAECKDHIGYCFFDEMANKCFLDDNYDAVNPDKKKYGFPEVLPPREISRENICSSYNVDETKCAEHNGKQKGCESTGFCKYDTADGSCTYQEANANLLRCAKNEFCVLKNITQGDPCQFTAGTGCKEDCILKESIWGYNCYRPVKINCEPKSCNEDDMNTCNNNPLCAWNETACVKKCPSIKNVSKCNDDEHCTWDATLNSCVEGWKSLIHDNFEDWKSGNYSAAPWESSHCSEITDNATCNKKVDCETYGDGLGSIKCRTRKFSDSGKCMYGQKKINNIKMCCSPIEVGGGECK